MEPEVVAMVMKELIEEGKIKALGAFSEANEEYLRRAHAISRVSSYPKQIFDDGKMA